MVARQVIPDQQHAQWWQLGRERDTYLQPVLPPLPTCPILLWAEDDWGRQRGQHCAQFSLQPRMEHAIRAPPGPFDPNPPGCRMKEGQQLGRPLAKVCMGLACRMLLWLPTGPRGGDGLERYSFILPPDRQPQGFAFGVGDLDQLLVGAASGSRPSTIPRLRV